MKENDPSEMGNKQGVPQLITFREFIGHGIGKGGCRRPSRVSELNS